MESGTLQVFLRVLYTVNNNPQYILAKSSCQIPVAPCSEIAEEPETNEPTYARAPLKACLTTLCDSSPELLQDSTRDFSLYFLDPLETKPLATGLAHASCSTDSPRGVAVALGLMSWALESDNSTNVYVTGTIMPNVSPSLEVVCALRETRRMPRPMLQSYPPIGPIHASNQSQLPHAPCLAQNSGMSRPHTPRLQHDQQQQQQTLTRSADFPELYIGPPRRARGRPEGSISSKSKTKVQSSTTSLPGPSSFEATNRRPESKQGPKQKAKPRPPRPPPTYSPFICAPLTRTARSESDSASSLNLRSHMTGPSQDRPQAEFHHQAQSPFHPTDNPLLELVSAISTTSGVTTSTTPEQQAALISVLQGLFAANPDLVRLAATSETLPADIQKADTEDMHKSDNAGNPPDDSDSDIVILDSSTIDTTAFRKPSTSQQVERTDSPSLPASMLLPAQENKSASSQTSTLSGAPEPTSTVMAGTEKSEHDYSARVGRSLSHTLDMPATPTPSRTRKRKLNEYSQDRAHWFIPTSPPSPSQSVKRVSSSAITIIGKHSLPTGRTSSVSSSSTRLPSMLGSLRSITTPASHPQSSSSGYSAHGRPASWAPGKNGDLPDAPLSGSRSEQGIGLDACSLKRRRTLTEFMAEHEARKSVKARKYSSSGRRLGPGVSANTRLHADPPRSTDLESTSGHALSSPSRPLFRSDVSAFPLPASVCLPGLMPSTVVPSSSLSSMTSMGSSTASTITQIKNPLKNFVIPAWARTGTAMLPRLSEEALARQKAEQEAKKAQASLRRREAAKAKRKRSHHVDPPLKNSSDEDETGERKSRTPPPSSGAAQTVPESGLPLPALPVFASDAVAPIPSSSPRSHRQPMSPAIPSTPPRRPISMSESGSGSHRTPSKSGSCSLFTPSSQNPAPLFTPSTPSLYTPARFTPRSPLMLRRPEGTAKSPRKGALHTPRTPRRSDNDHSTPRSLRTDRHPTLASPNVIPRTLQTGMGTRAFLLPPTSPCVPLTPQRPQGFGGPTPTLHCAFGTPQHPSALATHAQNAQREGHEDGTLIRDLNDALRGEDVVIPSARPIQGSDAMDNTGEDAEPAEEGYHSSPLPPSSPLPASPLSSPSPAKHDNDTRAPTASDADGMNAVDTVWLLSDDGLDPTTAWVDDSDAGAWFTESEAWLTDAEGGPLPTDSDAAWLSDSDAISSTLGNLTCSLPSWLSDATDADETDSKVGRGTRATESQDDVGFDTAAFQKAYAVFVDHAEASIGTITNSASAHRGRDTKGTVESNFWESVRKEEGAALNDTGTAGGVATLDTASMYWRDFQDAGRDSNA